MKARRRLVQASLMAGLLSLAATSPALAQSAGGDLGGFIQNLIDLLNSNVIRGLAILAVMITGIMWLFGRLDLQRAGTVVVAIIVTFGAATIVDLVTGAGGS
jgi:type IV secretory pathway VirB2 component (pilin)